MFAGVGASGEGREPEATVDGGERAGGDMKGYARSGERKRSDNARPRGVTEGGRRRERDENVEPDPV